jgi:transmembrane protein TMEM43
MPDVFTETTSRGFFSRVFGSFIGILVGPLIVIAAVMLLWWNEGRAVRAITGLHAAASDTVELQGGNPSPSTEGKLIHVVGAVAAGAPVADPTLSVNFPGQVAVARTAEMYQWQEKSQSNTSNNLGGSQTTTTTYTYTKAWTDTPIDSSLFHHPEGHTNPAMPIRSQLLSASDAKLGGFTLDLDTLHQLDFVQPISPDAPAGWTTSGGQLFKGNPAASEIGDMRISYRGLPAGSTISVLAAQSHNGFAPFVTANGYTVHLAAMGNQPTAIMIAAKQHSESTLTWILRGVGTLATVIGFALLLGPISTIASVVPFLGGIVRGAAVFASMTIGIPLSLLVIALAWIGHRPLIGGLLLAAAVAIFYGLWRVHASRSPAQKTA